MSLPPDSANDRRAVPRHIRDGEHDMWRDGLGDAPGAERPARAGRLWIVLLVLVIAGAVVIGLLRR